MSKEDVINYVMTTPNNPNRAVLSGMLDGIDGLKIHICTSEEYDATSKTPIIEKPNTSLIYLVPTSEESGDLFDEFIWTGEAWERFGAGSVNVPKNIVDGSATGSLRTTGSSSEHSFYTLGAYAFSEGGGTEASGNQSHAEGSGTKAKGADSHAEGASTTASGAQSHAEGYGTTAAGAQSHAEGNTTTASGSDSHAEGSGTTASGISSHAEGYYCTAKFNQSQPGDHVEGYQTLASGGASHSEGCGTTASAHAAHAEGNTTKASAPMAHAEGSKTTAAGISSHAEGTATIANSINQHVFGIYNIEDTPDTHGKGTYVEIVGNGYYDSKNKQDVRSNARTLDWSGNEQLAGSLTLGMGTADEVTVTAAQLKALIALLNA